MGEPKLATSHVGFGDSKGVITDAAPVVVDEDLQTTSLPSVDDLPTLLYQSDRVS